MSMLRMAALVVGVASFAGILGCSRAASEQPVESQVDEAEPTAQSFESPQLLVRASIVLLDEAGVQSDEGTRLLNLADAAAGRVLSDQELQKIATDQAALIAAGQAQVVSQPSMIVLAGQAGTIDIIRSTPATATTQQVTRTDQFEVTCAVDSDGFVDGRYRLLATQETGELEHAAAKIGLPVGDRALIDLSVRFASGATVLGSRSLSSSNDLGGAIFMQVTTTTLPVRDAAED